MSRQIPDPYFQRVRSAVSGQVVGVVVPTCLIGVSFGVFPSQIVNKNIALLLAAPTNVAVQNGPNQSPTLSRAIALTVGVAVRVTASLSCTPGDEPVINGANQSPVLGVLAEVSVLP